MSDICFAIEKHVEEVMVNPEANWHVDRSRNDVQATAQLMFGRQCLVLIIDELIAFIEDIMDLADQYSSMPMPGYTHYQSAQIITIGFYLSSMSETLQKSVERMLLVYDQINECPLGSGAMSGLELSWDRHTMAKSLGFARSGEHALVGVSSKDWMLSIGNEWSITSTNISRFITDFIAWGSSEYQFATLPDELSGISSAMPQKKNYPILERIRGKTAHILSYAYDVLVSQRNTPFTNLIETAKEGGSNFYNMYTCMLSIIRLFKAVIQNIDFDHDKMYEVCSKQFFGGFSLANLLAMEAGIPYRQAQVIAGKYIMLMIEKEHQPADVQARDLNGICSEGGFITSFTDEQLAGIFNVETNLSRKATPGSTNPHQVKLLIERQKNKSSLQKVQLDNLAQTT